MTYIGSIKVSIKEEEVYRCVKKYIKNNNYPPLLREIKKMCDLGSEGSAHYYVRKLEEKGLIERERFTERGIKISNCENSSEVRNVLALSGGKDSTALAVYLRDKVENLEYVFCDTGREPPSLYDFIDELEDYLDCNIIRLHGGWHCNSCEEYGPDPMATTCPHCGGNIRERDFDYYMNRWSDDDDGPFIPGANSRWCTKHLKILPFERYIRGEANTMKDAKETFVYIGIRADEDRKGNYGDYKNVNYVYPFIENGLTKQEIFNILENANLNLPDYYRWRSTGGCYMCPFQRISDWKGLQKNHPDLFNKARDEENESKFDWNGTRSLDEIAEAEHVPEEWEVAESIWQGDSCTICGK